MKITEVHSGILMRKFQIHGVARELTMGAVSSAYIILFMGDVYRS
ncbi:MULTISPECIES: hypothetical protein [unclassified Pseudomonas]|nr:MULTISPECIES: hypothetical protein [unclassified Pseudomonas]